MIRAMLGVVGSILFFGLRILNRVGRLVTRPFERFGISARHQELVPAFQVVVGLLMIAAVLGGIVVTTGLFPVRASSGHWAITEWVLHFAMRRSVSTHSLGTKPPSLEDPDLILKGATHYEVGCRSCHGSPGMRQPRIPQAMTPHPPELSAKVPELADRELFYVVKHGVKFTGMPAWPAQGRDDEVWAMVAFLRKLPTLDEAGYHELVNGEPHPTASIETLGGMQKIPKAAIESCGRCHGEKGNARGTGAFPHLAGQRREYLENALKAYADGARHSGIMQPIAAGLTEETLRELAAYYAEQSIPRTASPADSGAIERGKAIAEQGIPNQRVPSCVECHRQSGARHKPAYPLLVGQPADYLVLQLELFRDGKRGGSEYAHLMHTIAPRLTDEQMRDVAAYFEAASTLRSAD